MQRWKFSIFSPNTLAVRICFSAISSVAISPVTGKYPQLIALRNMMRLPFRRKVASFPIPSTSNHRNPNVCTSLSRCFFPFRSVTRHVYRLGEDKSHSFASGTWTGIRTSFFPFGKETFSKHLENTIRSGDFFSQTVISTSLLTAPGILLTTEPR